MKQAFLVSAALALVAAGCHSRPAVSPAPDPSLDPRADQEARVAAGADAQRIGPALWGVAYDKDQTTDFRVPLEAGSCYWFGFAGDAGIGRLWTYVWSPADKRIDSSRGRGPEGVLKICATESGMHRLQGKVADGAGHFAIVIYKGPGLPAPPVAVAPAPVDLTAIIEAQAGAAAPGAARVGDFFAGTASTSDWSTAMSIGKCYWIIGAGDPGKVKKLFLYLWDPQGKRVTESRSDSSTAVIGVCPKDVGGMYKFQAKVDSGSGAYQVGIYVK
jgi:hypothetical protein